jgi:hypothetical protein
LTKMNGSTFPPQDFLEYMPEHTCWPRRDWSCMFHELLSCCAFHEVLSLLCGFKAPTTFISTAHTPSNCNSRTAHIRVHALIIHAWLFVYNSMSSLTSVGMPANSSGARGV